MDGQNIYAIPHLQTAQSGPFYELEKHILDHQVKIEAWFREYWLDEAPLLTASVDIRNAGFKISVVDTNLFPAGFNNLNPEFFPLCIQAAQTVISHLQPKCKNIVIIPENHTRNPHYFQNLAILVNILEKAGYDAQVGSLVEEQMKTIKLANDEVLQIHPLTRQGNQLVINNVAPCFLLLNNDLSEGVPELLKGIQQPIEPPPYMGWAHRSKSMHFEQNAQICERFANMIDVDPWQLNPMFTECEAIDFVEKEGMDDLIEKTDLLLNKIQQKYHEYNIEHKPFVIIKADAGTYGMAVMTVRSVKDLMDLNRKQRNSMSMRKGGQSVNRVIIQEGVPTFETVGPEQAVAEPVLYMIGQHVVGGFYRVHKGRDIDENLNTPGMEFTPLNFARCCNNPDVRLSPQHEIENQFYVYSVIARLALIASCQERDILAKDFNHVG